MILYRSRFVHQLPVGRNRILIVHAFNHMRLPADQDVDALLNFFAAPKDVSEACDRLPKVIPYSRDEIHRAIKGLIERRVLTEKNPSEELAEAEAELSPTLGRDPGEQLERYRRQVHEGAHANWSVESSVGVRTLQMSARRVDALLFGDCDIQTESDFLRQEALKRGIDLHVSATFPDDTRFAREHKHDAIFIGALRARHLIFEDVVDGQSPHSGYITLAHHLINQIRSQSSAPIFIDNLPEPTVQPLGMAEHGLMGHRTRVRFANIALSELAEALLDVFVVDVAATFSQTGSARLIDDGLHDFSHFGSPGWLLQRPPSEKRAVFNIFPDLGLFEHWMEGNPYLREGVLAKTHIDMLVTVLGIDRKKCIILDLDGTLWPGVLAETNAPFAWNPEISGPFSYIGLYFGLHEALLCLKKRGIVLVCVSKNDEKTVRDLWKYPDLYPKSRLLTPDDFVSLRINWNDKVDNIRSLADELGFALSSFLFIDDNPVERDRVRQRLPEVEVWGENPFFLRRDLLTDPRLQLPHITAESGARTEHVKAQIGRQALRADAMDESAYISSLNIQCSIDQVKNDLSALSRIEELFQRTTQFNATGRKFSRAELAALRLDHHAYIFTLDVSDRFGHHGLVGAAVILNDEIIGLAVSCRVLGMGVELSFIKHIIDALRATTNRLIGKIVPTSRNIPVRNIYKDAGFDETHKDEWQYSY